MDEGKARPIRSGAYGILFLLFASVLLLTHSPWLDLPYFWDEAGYYIPAAQDLSHGFLLPHSVPALIHPPLVPAYLAAVWSVAGFHAESTRCAMLLLAAGAGLFSLLLAIELLRDAGGMLGFLVAGLVCLSPVFFAQSLLAQLDMPAMLLSTAALWLFLRGRMAAAAAASVALVLVKETGVAAPLVFGAWLVYQRRWRDAAWFLAPLAALAGWVAFVFHATGHWTGTAGFADYNLLYPLHPLRIAVNSLRRVYYLCFANLHWIGIAAIAFAWRTSRIFRSHQWQVAGSFAIAQVALVTLLGGATLERYLLPALPVLYAAMAAGLSLFPRRPRLICAGALLAGLTAGIFINPPYPFPFEDNMALADFVRLQSDAAEYVEHWYGGSRVTTAWPLTTELAYPELGYVERRLAVDSLADFTPQTLSRLDWRKVQVLVAFSRTWNPPLNPLRLKPLRAEWERLFGNAPFVTPEELRLETPFPAAFEFRRSGQWVDVYVNPVLPPAPPVKPLRAVAR